jgi:peptidoglycan/xylan/chitin deacetylase (PgdA/CDA1 family)
VVPAVAAAFGLRRRIDETDSVAITFDDGPHPEGTPQVLEALRDADARATFFLIGEQVERAPSVAAEIAAAGHAIAVHGYRHRSTLRLTPGQFADDLDRGLAAIERATGTSPALFRPPYGIFSAAALREVRRRGLQVMLWSRWGHDWRRRRTPEAIAAEVTGRLRGGDVLLLHDADHYGGSGCWRNTVAAMPEVLGRIESAGLAPVVAVPS